MGARSRMDRPGPQRVQARVARRTSRMIWFPVLQAQPMVPHLELLRERYSVALSELEVEAR